MPKVMTKRPRTVGYVLGGRSGASSGSSWQNITNVRSFRNNCNGQKLQTVTGGVTGDTPQLLSNDFSSNWKPLFTPVTRSGPRLFAARHVLKHRSDQFEALRSPTLSNRTTVGRFAVAASLPGRRRWRSNALSALSGQFKKCHERPVAHRPAALFFI